MNSSFAQLFWKTWNLFIFSIALTFFVFLAEYGQAFVAIIEYQNNIPRGLSERLLSETVRPWIQYIDTLPYIGVISVAIFWAIAAIGMYILYVFVASLVESAKEQLRMDRLSTMGIVRAVCVHYGEKIIAITLFFVIAILGWTVLLGYWLQLINVYVLSGLAIESMPFFIAGLIGLWATIYTLLVAAYITWFYERRALS